MLASSVHHDAISGVATAPSVMGASVIEVRVSVRFQTQTTAILVAAKLGFMFIKLDSAVGKELFIVISHTVPSLSTSGSLIAKSNLRRIFCGGRERREERGEKREERGEQKFRRLPLKVVFVVRS